MSEVYKDHGYDVYHRVNKKYLEFQPDVGFKYTSLGDVLALDSNDVFIVYAPSFSALIESFLVRVIGNPRVVYFLH